MTWLLYLYKAEETDGAELRLSLRSIQRYLQMPDIEVMLVGDKPSWISGVHHVEGNPTPDKVHNMIWNVAEGCRHLRGENEVYFLADDYMLLDPTDSILPVCWGPLDEHVEHVVRGKGKVDWYSRALLNTHSLLKRAGISKALSFEMHRPLPLCPEDAAKCLDSVLKTRDLPFWRTTYGNLVGYDQPVHRGRDGLFFGNRTPLGLPWVSTAPETWDKPIGRRISALFPEPSRWEA